MAENTKIEWATHTFNPWRGCTKVSEGCAHCYAETLSHRNPAVLGEWGPGKERVRASAAMWKKPLKWNSEAIRTGTRPRVFCASLADVFDPEVPDTWRDDLFDLIAKTKNLDWLILTKRPRLMVDFICGTSGMGAANVEDDGPFAHVWWGVSAENQQRWDERVPILLELPARIRFASCEPLIGPIRCRLDDPHGYWSHDTLRGFFFCEGRNKPAPSPKINWIIAGGESGPGARPMHRDWARSIQAQCQNAGTPFFFKQWGGTNKKATGRLLDGHLHNEIPAS